MESVAWRDPAAPQLTGAAQSSRVTCCPLPPVCLSQAGTSSAADSQANQSSDLQDPMVSVGVPRHSCSALCKDVPCFVSVRPPHSHPSGCSILEERLWQKPWHLPRCQARGSLPERQARFSCHHFLHKANFIIISKSQENCSKYSKPHMPRSNSKFTSLFPSQMHRITC